MNDPREELAEIAASVRALVEWYDATGVSGLPRSEGAPRSPAAPTPAVVAPARAAAPPPARAAAPTPPAFVAPAPAPAPQPAAPAPQRLVIPEGRAAVAAVARPLPAATTPDERRTRLALLAEEARTCTRCVLSEKRKQAVFARGNPFAELCFVGEGPGADEDALGEPFVGAAGQLLDRMIGAMGFARDEVYICNVVKCRPPDNRKPERDEMAACDPFLHQQLALVQPKVIVALGATAVAGMLGATDGITRMRGKWKLYRGAVPVMPTFHPAYLLRQPAAKRDVWSDLQEVMRLLGKAPKAGG